MDIVYVKVKDLSKEEFEEQKKNILLDEGMDIPAYAQGMILAYGIDAESFIVGGDEIIYWPVILDPEQQDLYDLQFDEENPPKIAQETLMQYDLCAYEDAEEATVSWYDLS